MRLLMLSVSNSLVNLVVVPFCLLASRVVHGFRSVLLCAFSSGCSFVLRLDFKWPTIDDDTEKHLKLSVVLVWPIKLAEHSFVFFSARNCIIGSRTDAAFMR